MKTSLRFRSSLFTLFASNVLRLVNVLGEELISVYFKNKIDLDMTNLSKGIYFVQLLDKNKLLFSKKVIKE